MDLEQRLRQLHKIEPDQAYARASRARILATSPKVTWRVLLGGILQSSSAVALVGVLLIMAAGAFSLWRLIGPLAGIDPNVYAEAKAVDVQLHLANLQYKDAGSFGRTSLIATKSAIMNTRTPNSVGTGTASEPPVASGEASPAPTVAPSSTVTEVATSSPVEVPTVNGVGDLLDLLSK